MRNRRPGWAVAGLIALICVAAACSSSSRAARTFSVVALGDSVPRGTNCHCTPYPPLTANALEASSGEAVKSTNDSVAGATTSDVLKQLTSDRTVRADVRGADVIEIEIGANDVGYSSSCGTSVECYAPRIPVIQKNLTAIVQRVRKLAANRKVLVVLLDYWSVWLGGQYAAAKGDAYVAAAEEVTDRVDARDQVDRGEDRLGLRRPAGGLQGTGLRLRRDALPLERRRPSERSRPRADRDRRGGGDRQGAPRLA